MRDKNWLDKVNTICSTISALAALLALIIVLYPQIKPSNANHLELANAGKVDSQMFLANYYYEVGDLSQSVYWYTVASQTEGDHQAKAINNLAYIYLTYDQFSKSKIDLYGDTARMLCNAAEDGELKAAKNLYVLLISNPEDLFGNQVEEYMKCAEDILAKHEADWREVQKYDSRWVYLETQTGDMIPPNDSDYRYEPISMECVLGEDPYRLITIYTYKVYQRVESNIEPKYFYAPIE